MSFAEGDGFDAPVLEGVLWGLTTAAALWRTRRAAPGTRAGWLLIAAGLVLIVVDKAFDVHALAHACGTWVAAALDPEHHLRGPHAFYRYLALGTGFVAALAVVVVWLRRDARVGRGKWLCFAGLLLIGALLAARLAPGLEVFLPDWITKAIELAAWLCVGIGLWRGDGPAAPRRQLVDGFL